MTNNSEILPMHHTVMPNEGMPDQTPVREIHLGIRGRTAQLGAGLLTAVVTLAGCSGAESSSYDGSPSGSATPAASSKSGRCADSWEMTGLDHTNNRIIGQGLPALKNAKTNEQAAEAAHKLIDTIQVDAAVLKGYAKQLIDKDVVAEKLTDAKGCATNEAKEVVAEMNAALALSNITPDDPTGGHNTGYDNGTVVASAQPGVSGDTSGISIQMVSHNKKLNGRKIGVLARCGNLVLDKTDGHTHGHTDENPEKPTTPPTTPPTTTTKTTPSTPTTTTSTTTPPRCPSKPSYDPNLYTYDDKTCVLKKIPLQSNNVDPTGPRNPGRPDPQTNRGNQETAQQQPSTVPSVAPPNKPPQPLPPLPTTSSSRSEVAPPPTPGGYNGGSTNNPITKKTSTIPTHATSTPTRVASSTPTSIILNPWG